MGRFAALLVGFLAAAGALATPALATFHLNMVNEAMLASSSGDSSVQFVEFFDHGGSEEAFPPVFAPYKLVVYDGAANKLGEQTLDPTGLRAAAAANREYLVSTPAADAAFGVTGDERLTVQLPRAAGQACYQANPNPPAFSCITWGTVTKPVPTNSMGTGSAHGPVPPNGESDQLLTDNSVVAAPPTPKAANRSAPGSGGGTTTFTGAGFGPRSIKVAASGRAHVRLACPAGSGGCTGRLTLTAAKRPHARLAVATFSIAAGHSKAVTIKLNAAGRRLLARSGTVKARAVSDASNSSGRRKSTSATLTLVKT